MPDDTNETITSTTETELDPVSPDPATVKVPDPVEEPTSDSEETTQEETFTKAEVEAMIRERVARVRREQRLQDKPKEPQRPEKKSGAKPSTEPTSSPSRAAERAFDRAVGKYGLTDFQEQLLDRAFQEACPDRADVAAFIEDFVAEAFPGKALSEPQPTRRETNGNGATEPSAKGEPVKKPANPNAIDNNAPAVKPGWQQVVNPDNLSRDQVAQILNEKGKRAGGRYLRNMVESYHRNTRVVPPPKSDG